MSEAFRKAEEWVRQQLSQGRDLASIQASLPGFRDGPININRVLSLDPLLLGHFDEKLALKISDDVVRAAWKVAKLRGLNVYSSSHEVRIVKDGITHGLVMQRGFAASSPDLFSDLAASIFGLGGAPLRGVGVKDRWRDSIAALISDRKVVELIFTVLLLILLPTTLAAASLLITPSIIIPDIGRIAVVILLLYTTYYIAKRYIAENIKTRKSS